MEPGMFKANIKLKLIKSWSFNLFSQQSKAVLQRQKLSNAGIIRLSKT